MGAFYLGDGAYAHFEGADLVLTTSDGHAVTNRVVLEPEVLLALLMHLDAEGRLATLGYEPAETRA